jgi:DNA invertase Pin-like site-specific DNA recombinase
VTAPTVSRRVGLYCRVSTTGQTAENQLLALRSFAVARGWAVTEFVDHGVSGAKEKRPALDALHAAVRARRLDVVACVKLDRLARSVRHLVAMVREFEALGVDLVVLDQAIDTTTPSGRLLFHVLASISEFERELIRDRVLASLRRAKSPADAPNTDEARARSRGARSRRRPSPRLSGRGPLALRLLLCRGARLDHPRPAESCPFLLQCRCSGFR